MDSPSFSNWLVSHFFSVQEMLLISLESKDRLLYVIGPSLKAEYFEKIGQTERPVLENELEVLMLEKKKDLIQRSINRGEEINLAEIDERVKDEREKKISDLKGSYLETDALPILTDDETKELNSIYHMIVKKFHPATNPGQDAHQRKLYEQALEAYKRLDINSLRLLSDVLMENEKDEIRSQVLVYLEMKKAGLLEEKKENINEIEKDIGNQLSKDYSMAEKLFGAYKKTPTDMEIYNKTMEYIDAIMEIKNEVDEISKGFPYNAQDTLRSQEKTASYLKSLEIRNADALNKKADLMEKIEKMVSEHQQESRS